MERREKGAAERDFVGQLLSYRDENGEGLSEEQIADNVIGVLFAAQDTTASVLTWILKYLHDSLKLFEAVRVRMSFCFFVQTKRGRFNGVFVKFVGRADGNL